MGMVIVAVIYGFVNMKAENPFLIKLRGYKLFQVSSLHLVP